MFHTPRDLGLPHNEWRQAQYDAYRRSLTLADSNGGTLVVEAPVGVGKSGIPTALGHDHKVTVLAHNHGLLDQYEEEYGFDVIKGKPEYPCVLESKVQQWQSLYGYGPSAGDCHFHDMGECPAAANCPYIIARDRALASNRMACTYKYAALSKAVQNRPGILVMDECHDAYEELIEFAKFEMDDNVRRDFKFPDFPLIDFGANGDGDILEGDSRDKVAAWVMQCIGVISVLDIFGQMTQEGSKNQRMFERLTFALNMFEDDKPVFFRCRRNVNTDDWRNAMDARPNTITLIMRSLDVKDVVMNIASKKNTRIMMSATIGNPDPLMQQLGLGKYNFVSYDHPIPKDKRPVYDLGIEKMTKANLDKMPGLYKVQANRISDFIKSFDPRWRGIVLTSSYFKINLLRKFMNENLRGRILYPEKYANLSSRIQQFINSKQPGCVAVDSIQGWGTGLSLVGDMARISVVAGVPHPNPGDRFDQLRMSSEVGRRYAFWSAYCAVAQATGRVTRGEKELDGSYMLNVGAIADGSALIPMAKGMMPKWLVEAIVKW